MREVADMLLLWIHPDTAYVHICKEYSRLDRYNLGLNIIDKQTKKI